MNSNTSLRRAFLSQLGASLWAQSASRKPPVSPALDPPASVQRPMQDALRRLGQMIWSYALPEDRQWIVEIDAIVNDTGIDKEMPSDIAFYCRQAITDILGPFRSFRTWPYSIVLNRPGAAYLPGVNRPAGVKPPIPDFKLVGQVLRASEISVKGREIRFDLLARKADAQATRDHRATVTNLVIGLGLDSRDGLDIPGATARYHVRVEKSEKNSSVSLYIAGTGGGLTRKLVQSPDIGDAIYDATAALLMHLFGHAFVVPYYRCSPIFTQDSVLDANFRDSLKPAPRLELERRAKRLLFAAGFSIDLTGPDLTVNDRALLKLCMQQHRLQFEDTTHLANFIFSLWSTLDFERGATIIKDRLAANTRADAEQKAAAKQSAPPKPVPEDLSQPPIIPADVGPRHFNWPPSTRMVVLDLTSVPNPAVRESILGYARQARGFQELRPSKSNWVIGIRTAGDPFELQRSLRMSPLSLHFQWADSRQPRLNLSSQ